MWTHTIFSKHWIITFFFYNAIDNYIENNLKLYLSIHKFLENSDEELNEENFPEIYKNREEMHQFLEIISRIGEHHHHNQNFNEKMNQILLHYQEQIKQTMPNDETFDAFKNSKKLVHLIIVLHLRVSQFFLLQFQ